MSQEPASPVPVGGAPATAPPEQIKVYPGDPVPLMWKRLVELMIENPGLTAREAGKLLGVNHHTVHCWTKKFEFQRYENWVLGNVPLEQKRLLTPDKRDALVEIRAKYETYLDEMQERLMHILETTDSEKLQVEIIQDIHDRVGFVSKKDGIRATPFIFTPEAVREFFSRANEAGLIPSVAGEQSPVGREVLEGETLNGSSSEQVA